VASREREEEPPEPPPPLPRPTQATPVEASLALSALDRGDPANRYRGSLARLATRVFGEGECLPSGRASYLVRGSVTVGDAGVAVLGLGVGRSLGLGLGLGTCGVGVGVGGAGVGLGL